MADEIYRIHARFARNLGDICAHADSGRTAARPVLLIVHGLHVHNIMISGFAL